jgi:glycosyltransferase involved in cell wall biosynthesis
LKILHFILGKANKSRANGVNQVIAGLAKYSARLGAEIRVIGKAETVSHEGESIPRDGFTVNAYSRWGDGLCSALKEGIRWADIVHLHGVYSPWNLMVARMCDALNRPYIVTLHDGLAPERSLARGRLKKQIFHAMLQRGHLERAAGVHVLTEEEATDLLDAAKPRNIFCIPNGIDLEDYPHPDLPPPPSANEINIGYLGRLSAEKNLEALCLAFSSVNTNSNMRLKLAGPSTSYGDSLQKRFSPHGVMSVGAQFGEEKTTFIRSLDLFVHPSLCDVFSIAAMEVLALGTPLLITRTSKASYLYDRNAYFMCEPTSFGLERGLRMALDRRMEWRVKAANGRNLIEERLNWHAAAKDMLEAYGRIARTRT